MANQKSHRLGHVYFNKTACNYSLSERSRCGKMRFMLWVYDA